MVDVKLFRVTKQYPGSDEAAVADLSLDVPSGEFLSIMGESGAGKTTLLRLIAGLEDPDVGDIYVGGERMNDVSVGRRPVQMIFQSLALWPHLKVMDVKGFSNITFPLKVRRWSPTRTRPDWSRSSPAADAPCCASEVSATSSRS